MSLIKRYTVEHEWHDHTVTLEVDHQIMTPELAKQHLDYWSGSAEFQEDENGDAVRAVIRLFGASLIARILEQGGATFSDDTAAKIWSREQQDAEGWAGASTAAPFSPFGNVGIRAVSASVDGVGFDDVRIKEIATA
jgi:Protein of unknown function (DUF2528)